ncbi:MAG: branched-chain amino acid ABC transporter permease, partial [Mariniphaga sp.]
IAIVALGFALVYNTTKIFHIAYAVLYTFAPYIFFTFHTNHGLNFGFAAILAIISTVLLSMIIELVVYQPLQRKKSSLNQVLISSIGVMIIVTNLLALLYGNETKMINPGISGSLLIGNVLITNNQIIQVSVSLFLIILFFLFLKYSKFGLVTRALRDDEYLSKVFAVNIRGLRLLVFGLSGLFAAIGGLLVAYDVGIDPYVGMPMLLNAFVALIIGGAGKFYTPVIGAFVIGILQSLTIWQFSANWCEAITFVLLICFLIFRPQGLAGELQREV